MFPRTHNLEPPKFRFALVIEEADSFRMSVVKVLRAQGWFVHGIMRPEQAFHILAYIPYGLIVIDSEHPGMCGSDFVRILHNFRKWWAIQLVVITSSQSAGFAIQVAECGAFLARKSTWQDDLSSFLSGHN
jgi:DNA-binding response OmpR family regulator